MKNIVKVTGLSLAVIMFAGCSQTKPMEADSDMASLRASVEQARSAAEQANNNAMAARQLAEQNAEKINRVFRKSQMK